MPGRVVAMSSTASGANGANTAASGASGAAVGDIVNGSAGSDGLGGDHDGASAAAATANATAATPVAVAAAEKPTESAKMAMSVAAAAPSPGDDSYGAVVNGGGATSIKVEGAIANGQLMKIPASLASAAGPEQLLANGVPVSSTTVNQGPSSSFKVLPPEIQHIAEGYVSMGKLIERVVQLTWNDLTELIEKLADMPVDTQSNSGLANGVSTIEHGRLGSESAISLQKRLMWLDFAKTHRDRFIKLAVISQWSKNVADVRMFIDLMCWSNERFTAMEEIARSLGQLKLDLHPFKMPNPDIKTALEVLSTGKASWMPDLGLLPLPPLTPQKMLSTLQDMNVLLHIRLTLHEDLPHYLRNWKCANGRATFTFPGEFEFDVILLEEDPSAQFWFEDLRFLFTPSFVIPDGVFRARLQEGADEALKNSGITGCAESLRNFVLTHQITLLRNQLSSLIKGIWKSVLNVEQRHRSLIVQYWAESPFAKSWLEIGISSGKGKKRLIPGRVELPKVTAKWKRYGEEVPDGQQLDLRLENLSMEGIIRRAISIHSSHLLRTTRDLLQKSASDSAVLSLDMHESIDEPIDCKLVLQLGSHSPKMTFAVEQFSGRLTLHPVTPISHGAEYELNSRPTDKSQGPTSTTTTTITTPPPRNPTRDTAAVLESSICRDLFWRIERQAAFSGWEPVAANVVPRLTLDGVRDTFGVKAVRWGFFRPGCWSDLAAANWVLCVTISLHGCSWWAVELYVPAGGLRQNPRREVEGLGFADVLDRRTNALDRPAILAVQGLPLASSATNSAPLDATLLANLEDEAERCIAELLATQQMRLDATLFNGWSSAADVDVLEADIFDQLMS